MVPEFLLGDDLLVVPVVEEGVDSLKVVLPPGSWRQKGGDITSGPTTITLNNITIDSIIYFSREPSSNIQI